VPLEVHARAGLLLLYPDMNKVFHLSAVAELGVRWDALINGFSVSPGLRVRRHWLQAELSS